MKKSKRLSEREWDGKRSFEEEQEEVLGRESERESKREGPKQKRIEKECLCERVRRNSREWE